MDVVIAELVEFGREIAPIVPPYLAIVAKEEVLALLVRIERDAARIAFVGIDDQRRKNSGRQEAAELDGLGVLGRIDKPVRLIARTRINGVVI